MHGCVQTNKQKKWTKKNANTNTTQSQMHNPIILEN